jgi:hypothetical protein
MTTPTGLSFATLLDWLEGRLDPAEASQVSAQVAEADGRTRAAVVWLQSFLATTRAFPAPEPPPIVRQNLRQHFVRWSKAQAALRARPEPVAASLLFDSRQDLALAGFRSGDEADEAYHLAFTTDVADLVIDVRRIADGQVRLDGQVLPGNPAAAPVFAAEAVGQGFRVRTVDGDELGRFTLPEVPAGPCRLEVSNGETILRAEVDLTG